jgi:hypothetical protein
MGIRHSAQYAEVPGLMYASVPPKATTEYGWRLPLPRIPHLDTGPLGHDAPLATGCLIEGPGQRVW